MRSTSDVTEGCEATDGGKQHPRRIQTVTTLPLGAVDESEVDTALVESYDKPLWKVLFVDTPDDNHSDPEHFRVPTGHWLDRRHDLRDISTVDPSMEESYCKFYNLRVRHSQAEQQVMEKETELKTAVNKLDVAAASMLGRQRSLIASSGNECPDDTPLFKVHQQNIEAWRKSKIDVMNQAFGILLNERDQLHRCLTDVVLRMIEESYMVYLNNVVPHQSSEIPDLGLMKELENWLHDSGVSQACPNNLMISVVIKLVFHMYISLSLSISYLISYHISSRHDIRVCVFLYMQIKQQLYKTF